MLQVVASLMIIFLTSFKLIDLSIMAIVKIIRIMIISDAPSCGVTYNHHSNIIYAPWAVNYGQSLMIVSDAQSWVVTYDNHSDITHAHKVMNYAYRKHSWYSHHSQLSKYFYSTGHRYQRQDSNPQSQDYVTSVLTLCYLHWWIVIQRFLSFKPFKLPSFL